jgi:STE24 endopeptidase
LSVSAFWIFFSLILARVAPLVIIPLFFKYKPVSDNLFGERIRGLARKMNVKILDVFEIDLSKKTRKANAALVGWGAGRRVLLADTLNDKYSHDEIEVILAHEFAHYKLGHLPKLIAINSLGTLLSFFLIFKTCVPVMWFFGVSSFLDIAGFPVIVLYLTLLEVLLQPSAHFVSRAFEKDADVMALEVTGAKDAFISMMEKLSLQNLTDRNPHPVIKFFFFDHPPIEERIALASK